MKTIYPLIGLAVLVGIVFLGSGHVWLTVIFILAGVFYFFFIMRNNIRGYRTSRQSGGRNSLNVGNRSGSGKRRKR